jgi:hypothetical protein
MKGAYDQHHRELEFAEGDRVWLRLHHRQGWQYGFGFQVTRRFSTRRVRVQFCTRPAQNRVRAWVSFYTPRVDPKPEKVHDCVYFSPAYPFSSHRCIRYISRTATVVALGTPHPSRHPSLSSTGQVGDASQAHRSAP